MQDLLTAVTPLPAPLIFAVPGDPRGKGRHKTRVLGHKMVPSKTKAGVMVKKYMTQEYTDKETAAYEAMVRGYARAAMRGRLPFEGPVHLEMVIYCPIAPSWTKKKQAAARSGELLPVCKPDGDNVLKAVKDALNEVAYADDKQVASFAVRKEYSDSPRLGIAVVPGGNGVPVQPKTQQEHMQVLGCLLAAGLLPQSTHDALVAAFIPQPEGLSIQALA